MEGERSHKDFSDNKVLQEPYWRLFNTYKGVAVYLVGKMKGVETGMVL